jgi:hypothetical protein
MLPESLESQIQFYKNLSLYYPVLMEFVPSTKVIFKLIERAAQLDPEKIDIVLNPY